MDICKAIYVSSKISMREVVRKLFEIYVILSIFILIHTVTKGKELKDKQ